MIRVPYQEVFETLQSILIKFGFTADRASLCASLFAETSRDGVYSHGLARFPRFIRGIQNGLIDIHATPALVTAHGPIERWDGKIGAGNLNAYHSMERAITLARQYGMGCVALANTNHWMRGGTYGWQAAEAGMIGICWTNTLPNVPPWGATDSRVGNNPLIVAVPRPSGHVVLDMAMSQFSYGALASYRLRGELLPVDGGFDSEGRLTRDPGAIEASGRPLPIGYWKGSGLALMLDLVGGLLSGGLFTCQVPPEPERETKLSQVFMAFNFAALGGSRNAAEIADQVIESLQMSKRSDAKVRYPGQHVLETRIENMAKGIPVAPSIWQEVIRLSPEKDNGSPG